MTNELFYCTDADAVKYGLDAAIVLTKLASWIRHNKAQGRNQHEGRTWTYNTRKALGEMFCFLKPRQIDRIIRQQVEAGVLMTGRFNHNSHDRTMWYSFTDEAHWMGDLHSTSGCTMEESPARTMNINSVPKHESVKRTPKAPKIDTAKRNREATANAAALCVFDYHVETLSKALGRQMKWRATRGLLAKITLRLKTFSIDECKLAIDNLAVSPHHLGQNDRGTEYCSPNFLFHTDERVSDWVAKEKHEPELKDGKALAARKYIRNVEANIAKFKGWLATLPEAPNADSWEKSLRENLVRKANFEATGTVPHNPRGYD